MVDGSLAGLEHCATKTQRHKVSQRQHPWCSFVTRRLSGSEQFVRLLLALPLILGLATGLIAFASQEQQPDFTQLEKTVLEELKETNSPGATVAIVSGDGIVYSKGFGISNVETGAPMTPDMLFRIGSTTKMFTATALVTLAEEGRIKLEEPIENYVK